jgi:hypothetical protein
MQSRLVLCLVALCVTACAAPVAPETKAEVANSEPPRERCETVLTGSRIPQCNRGDVKVMTREEIERQGLLSNPATSTGTLLPGKSH